MISSINRIEAALPGASLKIVSNLSVDFAAGEPFPLVIIDDFLEEDLAEELLEEFPSMDGMARSNDYMFGDKRQHAMFAQAGPASRQYYDLVAAAKGKLTGKKAE
jgi:hypothetical protein